MKTTGIREGDILHCDVRGRRFFAVAQSGATTQTNTNRRGVEVAPLNGGYVAARFVTPRQIIGHYTKRKGSA